MYEDVVKALRMCGYPVSYYWCSHGCCFAVDGSTCRTGPMISAAASAIEDLNERLNDYRVACERRTRNERNERQSP